VFVIALFLFEHAIRRGSVQFLIRLIIKISLISGHNQWFGMFFLSDIFQRTYFQDVGEKCLGLFPVEERKYGEISG